MPVWKKPSRRIESDFPPARLAKRLARSVVSERFIYGKPMSRSNFGDLARRNWDRGSAGGRSVSEGIPLDSGFPLSCPARPPKRTRKKTITFQLTETAEGFTETTLAYPRVRISQARLGSSEHKGGGAEGSPSSESRAHVRDKSRSRGCAVTFKPCRSV